MKTRKLIMTQILILSLAIYLNPHVTFQKVTTEVKLFNDIIPKSGKFPLPENAVELEHMFSSFSLKIKDPQRIARDLTGKIYVTDRKRHSVLIFSPSGEFDRQIGLNKKGKSKLKHPSSILLSKGRILVQDIERKRVDCFNMDGDSTKSIKLSNFSDIVSNDKGELFLTQYITDRGKPLLDVYTPKGKKKQSIGKSLKFAHSIKTLNSRRLAISDSGELFIAFSYFPTLRKYSQTGALLAEFRINNEIMKAKEKFNLQRIGEGMANTARRLGYIKLISTIKAFEDKLYLLAYFPRLEILELDKEGNVLSTYWKDFDEIYEAQDLAVQRHDGQLRFYVIKSFPDVGIDVFSPKGHRKTAHNPY